MATQTTLAPDLPGKTEPKATASARVEPQKAVPAPQPRTYWGDRWTLVFWLCCFAIMAGMNLVEAVRRFVLYLVGGSPPP